MLTERIFVPVVVYTKYVTAQDLLNTIFIPMVVYTKYIITQALLNTMLLLKLYSTQCYYSSFIQHNSIVTEEARTKLTIFYKCVLKRKKRN